MQVRVVVCSHLEIYISLPTHSLTHSPDLSLSLSLSLFLLSGVGTTSFSLRYRPLCSLVLHLTHKLAILRKKKESKDMRPSSSSSHQKTTSSSSPSTSSSSSSREQQQQQQEAQKTPSPSQQQQAARSPLTYERSLLYAAVRSGSPRRVTSVLQAGREQHEEDLRDALGTALHKAVALGHAKVTNILLEAGADVDARNSQAATPLHKAAEDGVHEILNALLRAGASLTLRNDDGKAPIAVAKNAATRAAIAAEARRRSELEAPAAPAASSPSNASPSTQQTTRTPPNNNPSKTTAAAKTPPSPPVPRPSSSTHRSSARRRKPASPMSLRGRRPPLTPTSPHTTTTQPPPQQAPCSPGLSNIDGLDCLVCLRRYCTERGTEPVTLPCGHTFCQSCVQTLRGCPPGGGEGVPHSFRCPIDRQVYSRHLELRVNTTLRDLVQRLPSLLRGQARSPLARRSENTAAPGRLQALQKDARDAATSPLARTTSS